MQRNFEVQQLCFSSNIHSLCADDDDDDDDAGGGGDDDAAAADDDDDDDDDVVDVSSGSCKFLVYICSVSFYIISHQFLTWIKVTTHRAAWHFPASSRIGSIFYSIHGYQHSIKDSI